MSGMNDAHIYSNNDLFNPYVISMKIVAENIGTPNATTRIEYTIYDTRHYSNMATIDFNFFGYSRASNPLKSLNYAKNRAKQLCKNEVA